MPDVPLDCLHLILPLLWETTRDSYAERERPELQRFIWALLSCARVSRGFHRAAQSLIDTHVVVTRQRIPTIAARFGLDCSQAALEAIGRVGVPVMAQLTDDARRIRVIAAADGGEFLLRQLLESSTNLEVVIVRRARWRWVTLPDIRPVGCLEQLHVETGGVDDLLHARAVHIDIWTEEGDSDGGRTVVPGDLRHLRELRVGQWRRLDTLRRSLERASALRTLDLGEEFTLGDILALRPDSLTVDKWAIDVGDSLYPDPRAGELGRALPAMLRALVIRGTGGSAQAVLDGVAAEMRSEPTYLPQLRLVELDPFARAPAVFSLRDIVLRADERYGFDETDSPMCVDRFAARPLTCVVPEPLKKRRECRGAFAPLIRRAVFDLTCTALARAHALPGRSSASSSSDAQVSTRTGRADRRPARDVSRVQVALAGAGKPDCGPASSVRRRLLLRANARQLKPAARVEPSARAQPSDASA